MKLQGLHAMLNRIASPFRDHDRAEDVENAAAKARDVEERMESLERRSRADVELAARARLARLGHQHPQGGGL